VQKEIAMQAHGGSAPFDILLIEDDPVSRKLVSSVIHKLGLQYASATHGREALDLCQQREFKLILVDLHMPGMDGYETRRRILALLDGREPPPMLCLTADTLDETRQRLHAQGFSECLYKPVDVERLTECLSRYIDLDPGLLQCPPPQVIPASLRAELYAILMAGLPQEYQRLCLAHKTADLDSLSHIAHTLAGNAAICGVSTLAQAARYLEQTLREADKEEVSRAYRLLLRLLEPLLDAPEPG